MTPTDRNLGDSEMPESNEQALDRLLHGLLRFGDRLTICRVIDAIENPERGIEIGLSL